MTHACQYAFNLFFNSACSFLAGLGVVWLAIRLFRIGNSRWKLVLLSLPFIKILWDLSYRGIPTSSIVHAGINPLSLPPKSQTLTIGAGFSEYGPIFNLVFTANVPGGKSYSASIADYLFALTGKYLGTKVPLIILLSAFSISLFLIIRRFVLAVAFERKRRRYRRDDQSLKTKPVGWRAIDIYLSLHFKGTPFTGGIFRPYICIPEETYRLLSADERRAVIAHELGHVKQWDLIGTLLVQGLGDIFWFVPFYRVLSRKIDRLREILADDSALDAGVAPEFLASALVRLQDAKTGESEAVMYSAFFREKKLLKVRVDRLLKQEENVVPSRFGWQRGWVRLLVTGWTAGAVMYATFGGNHEVSVKQFSSWLDMLPVSLGHLLRAWGFA
jgi:Zn-dependent protease with chaperone function